MLPFSYSPRATVLLVRNIVTEDQQWGFYRRFNRKFICPDVRALNATIFVHSTLNSIIGKGYCIWRSQMCYLADLNTSSYVLMLERWMLPFSYIQRPTVFLVRNIVSEDQQWGFYRRFNHKFICPDVRALNATIFVHSTLNSIIGKGYCLLRLHMNYLADSSTSTYVLMLERWMLPFSYIQRQTVLLVRNVVSEDHKWVFLAYIITRSYVLMLERWMLPFSYIQRPTVLLVRTIEYEDCK